MFTMFRTTKKIMQRNVKAPREVHSAQSADLTATAQQEEASAHGLLPTANLMAPGANPKALSRVQAGKGLSTLLSRKQPEPNQVPLHSPSILQQALKELMAPATSSIHNCSSTSLQI